jgi:predicted HTH transcriptional regulator
MILEYEIDAPNKTKLDELNELLEKHSVPTNVTGSMVMNGVKVQSRFVEITPSLANEIITRFQKTNRRISKPNVAFITKQMQDGTLSLTVKPYFLMKKVV